MQPIRDNKESKGNRVYSIISPVSLVAVVMLNFLLIYLNLVNLQNQSTILEDIQENIDIALVNQQIGLNASAVNHDLVERVLQIQAAANDSIQNLDIHMHQTNKSLHQIEESLDNLNISNLS